MYHRLWTLANILVVIISVVYIWLFHPKGSSYIMVAQLLALLALVPFLININMYFIFLVIRKSPARNVKIRLAKFSRQMMKWHIPIGLFGTTVIIGHAAINLSEIGPVAGYVNLKFITGYLALALLFLTLFAGWLRHKKASGFRRKFHLTSAMFFLSAFLVHMFILL